MSLGMLMGSLMGIAQPKDGDQRMNQDIEVAENILGTLLKQQMGRRNFFPMEVEGTYVAGHGVTFRLPSGVGGMLMGGFNMTPDMVDVRPGGMTYSYSFTDEDCEDCEREQIRAREQVKRPKAPKSAEPKIAERISSDSLTEDMQGSFLEVSKSFLADYGDVISGLKPDERIVITNRSDGFDDGFELIWSGSRQSKRKLLTVEAKRSDMDQLKQGKISRDEFMKRLTIINTETADELAPDLEVLSSMFGRLYREDLSKTYYVQGNVRYERMKDFGVIYTMKVYSSVEEDKRRFAMPTVDLRNLPQAERDQKVKELYPKFESDLKENIVEYGRTLRSLKDNEQLVFNVRLTKCVGCGIPATLELSIKFSALKDYSSGKATKEATLAKVSVKKTGTQ